MDRQTALGKAQHYCAYQERSIQEVRSKLHEWEVDRNDVDGIIKELEEGKFLDEARFSKAYALGKFRIKNWGKIKIRQGMIMKGLSEKLIHAGLSEIDLDDYDQKLQLIIQKKLEIEEALHPLEKKHKVSKYVISQGFESELVWEILQMQEN